MLWPCPSLDNLERPPRSSRARRSSRHTWWLRRRTCDCTRCTRWSKHSSSRRIEWPRRTPDNPSSRPPHTASAARLTCRMLPRARTHCCRLGSFARLRRRYWSHTGQAATTPCTWSCRVDRSACCRSRTRNPPSYTDRCKWCTPPCWRTVPRDRPSAHSTPCSPGSPDGTGESSPRGTPPGPSCTRRSRSPAPSLLTRNWLQRSPRRRSHRPRSDRSHRPQSDRQWSHRQWSPRQRSPRQRSQPQNHGGDRCCTRPSPQPKHTPRRETPSEHGSPCRTLAWCFVQTPGGAEDLTVPC